MKDIARITIDPEVCGGRPCIRGLRIRVSDVLDMLAAGMGIDDILRDYPDLERDDIVASLMFASQNLNHPVLKASRLRRRCWCGWICSCRRLSQGSLCRRDLPRASSGFVAAIRHV